MMSTRESLECQFKQLDHTVGLSFKSNFHFALVGHLLKGYRHPTPTTVTRTIRVLTMLLAIVAKPSKRDKFEVTPESVPYLTGMFITLRHSKINIYPNFLKIYTNFIPQRWWLCRKRFVADAIFDIHLTKACTIRQAVRTFSILYHRATR